MPGVVPSLWYANSFKFPTTLWDRNYYYFHFFLRWKKRSIHEGTAKVAHLVSGRAKSWICQPVSRVHPLDPCAKLPFYIWDLLKNPYLIILLTTGHHISKFCSALGFLGNSPTRHLLNYTPFLPFWFVSQNDLPMVNSQVSGVYGLGWGSGAKFGTGGASGGGWQLELDPGVGRLACGHGVKNKVLMPFESQINSEPSIMSKGSGSKTKTWEKQ